MKRFAMAQQATKIIDTHHTKSSMSEMEQRSTSLINPFRFLLRTEETSSLLRRYQQGTAQGRDARKPVRIRSSAASAAPALDGAFAPRGERGIVAEALAYLGKIVISPRDLFWGRPAVERFPALLGWQRLRRSSFLSVSAGGGTEVR